MNKKLSAALLLSLAAFASSATAGVLSVGLKQQEHSNWCWAASSQMVFGWFGKSYTQCSLANYSFGINYACGNATFYWNSNANSPNSAQAITQVLNAGGVSAYRTGALSQSALQSKIDASKPFIIGWYWTSGGGHAVVVKGYSGNYVYFNDPWPGNGSYTRTYSATVSASDRSWGDSMVPN